MAASLNFEDLPDDLKRVIRKATRIPRQQRFSAEQMRKWSIKVLATIAELEQDQRRRVLEHALKLNKV